MNSPENWPPSKLQVTTAGASGAQFSGVFFLGDKMNLATKKAKAKSRFAGFLSVDLPIEKRLFVQARGSCSWGTGDPELQCAEKQETQNGQITLG